MPRSSVSVDSDLADRLSDEAGKLGMTVYGLANECLKEDLSIFDEKGTPREIYSSWKMNKLTKEIGGFPLFTVDLITALVSALQDVSKENLLKIWFEQGLNLGTFLKVEYPNEQDLMKLTEHLAASLALKKLSFQRVTTDDEEQSDKVVYSMQFMGNFGLELTKCIEQYLRGIFANYAFQIVDSKVGAGVVELRMQVMKSNR